MHQGVHGGGTHPAIGGGRGQPADHGWLFTPAYGLPEWPHRGGTRPAISRSLQTKDGCTAPLHTACQHGHTEVVPALLSGGAQVNMQAEDDGVSPLHVACQEGIQRWSAPCYQLEPRSPCRPRRVCHRCIWHAKKATWRWSIRGTGVRYGLAGGRHAVPVWCGMHAAATQLAMHPL